MGDAAGEPADQLQALGALQVGLQLPLARHVHDQGGDAGDAAVLVPRLDEDVADLLGTVLGPVAQLQALGLAAEGAGEGLAHLRQVLGVGDGLPAVAGAHLLGAVAGGRPRRRVHVDDVPRGVELHQHDRQRLDQFAVLLLRGAHHFQGAAVVGHVGEGDDDARRLLLTAAAPPAAWR